MIDVEKILKETETVDDYRVTSLETKSYELFFVHRKLETVRATDTVTTDVTVYVRHDGKVGDSTFSLYQSMTEADVREKVIAAVNRAKLVFNEPFEIPKGGRKDTVLPSNMELSDVPGLASRIADAVFAADCYRDGSINATEIFVYQDTNSVKNSRGVDKTQVKIHVMIEAIPTWNEGGESVELYEDHRFTEFDSTAVTAEIDRRMREVRDRRTAVKPQTPLVCDVVLNPHEISELLREIVSNLDYSAVYSHSNLYKIGDDLQKDGSGDKLTVTMAGQLKGSVQSASFDDDGLDLGERTVIRDGVVESNFGSNRFACYLGLEPTGSLRCAKVAPGTLTVQELEKRTYLDCVSLSGLQVDLFNDYIGGEIRLAYYHDGGKKTPVTGISMSGRLSEVIASLRLLDSTVVSGSYEGPEKLLMKSISIL